MTEQTCDNDNGGCNDIYYGNFDDNYDKNDHKTNKYKGLCVKLYQF